MPIEIRELVIKTTVVEKDEKAAKGRLSRADVEKLKKEIMAECMEKIFDELKKEKER